jgi:hypothetical protein
MGRDRQIGLKIFWGKVGERTVAALPVQGFGSNKVKKSPPADHPIDRLADLFPVFGANCRVGAEIVTQKNIQGEQLLLECREDLKQMVLAERSSHEGIKMDCFWGEYSLLEVKTHVQKKQVAIHLLPGLLSLK